MHHKWENQIDHSISFFSCIRNYSIMFVKAVLGETLTVRETIQFLKLSSFLALKTEIYLITVYCSGAWLCFDGSSSSTHSYYLNFPKFYSKSNFHFHVLFLNEISNSAGLWERSTDIALWTVQMHGSRLGFAFTFAWCGEAVCPISAGTAESHQTSNWMCWKDRSQKKNVGVNMSFISKKILFSIRNSIFSCEVSRGVKILEKMAQYVDAASSKSPKFRDQYLADVKTCK